MISSSYFLLAVVITPASFMAWTVFYGLVLWALGMVWRKLRPTRPPKNGGEGRIVRAARPGGYSSVVGRHPSKWRGEEGASSEKTTKVGPSERRQGRTKTRPAVGGIRLAPSSFSSTAPPGSGSAKAKKERKKKAQGRAARREESLEQPKRGEQRTASGILASPSSPQLADRDRAVRKRPRESTDSSLAAGRGVVRRRYSRGPST